MLIHNNWSTSSGECAFLSSRPSSMFMHLSPPESRQTIQFTVDPAPAQFVRKKATIANVFVQSFFALQ